MDGCFGSVKKYPSTAETLFSILSVILCDLYLACANADYSDSLFFEIISLAAVGFVFVNLLMTADSRSVLIAFAVFGVLSYIVFRGSILIFAATVCALILISSFAQLISASKAKTAALACLAPLIAFGISIPATGFDFAASAHAAALFPAAFALGLFTRKGKSRVSAICACSALLFAAFAALFALSLYRKTGGISADLIAGYIDSVRSAASDMIFNSLSETAAAADIKLNVTTEDTENLVNSVLSLVPAIAVTGCNILAFISQRLLFRKLCKSRTVGILTPDTLKFEMSLTSAIIYPISFILAVSTAGLYDNTGRIVSTASENIFLILVPGLCVCGFLAVRRYMAQKRSIAVLLLAIAAFAILNIYAFTVLASVGGISIVISSVKNRRNDGVNKGDDNT